MNDETKTTKRNYSIAVDFDGVIHEYKSPWVDEVTIPDAPVEGAIEWLLEMDKKFKVVIFTTRGKTSAGAAAVSEWLEQHGVPFEIVIEWEVTAIKPPALIYLDDRAVRFEGPGKFPTVDEIHATRPWNKAVVNP